MKILKYKHVYLNYKFDQRLSQTFSFYRELIDCHWESDHHGRVVQGIVPICFATGIPGTNLSRHTNFSPLSGDVNSLYTDFQQLSYPL
jgi:hypothetical protein